MLGSLHAFLKILLLVIPSGIAAIPAIFVKKEMVGGAIPVMFTNYVIPMGVIGWYTVGGLYDWLVYKAEVTFGCKHERETFVEVQMYQR